MGKKEKSHAEQFTSSAHLTKRTHWPSSFLFALVHPFSMVRSSRIPTPRIVGEQTEVLRDAPNGCQTTSRIVGILGGSTQTVYHSSTSRESLMLYWGLPLLAIFFLFYQQPTDARALGCSLLCAVIRCRSWVPTSLLFFLRSPYSQYSPVFFAS
ncbi:hypothetical protein B0H63DRAFT_157809 [Podospora didyma]|uniref:Uncharacterized protein n=1 Tax=Podospora didyma TaxID=330526 RepID=A0AAE0NTX2_9PEZI|nr:hypothetical protein B0H63DRAFT_157809 [Podospora didyma]